MKIKITLALLFFALISKAQIPTGYYHAAEELSGDGLKSALHSIIKDHQEFPYSSSSTDTWDILKESDIDTIDPENVVLFYTGWTINADREYDNAKGWNREHVWARSHGGFSTSPGPGTDAHNLRPNDISVNGERGNKDFDNGGNVYVDGDGTTQCKTDFDSWEARDAVKGDVARILFYMAVRYEGENGELDLELVDQVNTDDLNESGKGFHGKLSTLLEWHKSDPVDSFETNRNNVIYSYQNNRNPFVDHPEYVELIWNYTRTESLKHGEIRVYPNPVKNVVNIELPNNEFAHGSIISITGRKIAEFAGSGNFTLQTNTIRPGYYNIRIVTEEKTYQSKIIIQN